MGNFCETYQVLENGYIVLRLTDLQNDKRSLRVGLVTQDGIITSAYVGLKKKRKIYSQYIYQLLHSYDLQKVFYNLGGGLRQSLRYEELKRLPILIPDYATQKQIADFLDKETTRIDTLVSRKQKQIELLQEKRQAIITQSVTRGLSASASRAEGNPHLPALRPKAGTFCIYVLKCSDASFYIGQSNDFPRRLREHEKGKISRTSKHLPVEPIHWEEFDSQEEAIKREKELKTGFGRKWLKEQYKKNAATSRQTSVKMKDSGVEWIGKIPEHWEVKRLRHVGNAIIGLTYSPNDVTDETEGTLVLRASNIHDGKITLEDNVFVNTKIPEKLRTRKGDILICSRNGSEKLVGKSGMITSNEEGLSFGAFTTIFRSDVNDYLFYFFNSGMMREQSGLFNTSTVFQLTTGILNNLQVAIPPDEKERNEVIKYLKEETDRNEILVSKIQNSITLLKEYRSSLITHAVSGQSLPPSVYGRQAAAGQPDTSKPACTSQADSCEFSG